MSELRNIAEIVLKGFPGLNLSAKQAEQVAEEIERLTLCRGRFALIPRHLLDDIGRAAKDGAKW